MVAPPKRLYLITDAGFAPRLLLNLAVLGASLYVAVSTDAVRELVEDRFDEAKHVLLTGAHRLTWWAAIGLLSSSCCVLQILLNALSLGCAGFNTYLGPARPLFLAATVLLQLSGWSVVLNNPIADWRYTALGSGIALVLALMPEAIYLYHQLQPKNTATPRSVAILKLEGMGCVSCATTVRQLAHKHGSVLDVNVSVNDGTATVQSSLVHTDAASEFDIIAKEISAAKFPCSVVSVQRYVPNDKAVAQDGAEAGKQLPEGSLQSWAVAVVAGLLSSSCCVLQMAINLLSYLDVVQLGCAGFNKVLGPIRTPLRVLTLAGVGMLWRHPKKRTVALLIQTCLTIGIMVAPELLLISGGPALAPATGNTVQYDISMDGMGCEACQMHVQKLLERSSGVVSAQVDFETGTAAVVVAEGWGFDMPSTQQKLEADGYLVSSIVQLNSTSPTQKSSTATESRPEL